MPSAPFTGFSLGLLHFLEELQRHNEKPWFDANRDRYERDVREPALRFIAAMEQPLWKISPHFTAVPKKVGGSLMRIYRDTRFSNDKRPYKTNVGIQFRHKAGRDVNAPAFYLHIDTDEVFFGTGMWHPGSAELAAVRQAIDEYPREWQRARDGRAFRAKFDLAGDSLQRAPRGYPADHRFLQDLKRKDHIAVMRLDHDQIFDERLVHVVTDACRATRPYMRFLCEAIGIDF